MPRRDSGDAGAGIGWPPGAVALVVAALLAAGALGGCSTTTRYEVLTFFFTGVPAPGEEGKAQAAAKAAAKAAPAKKAPPRPVVVVKSTQFGHGPYAANQCYTCHEVSASGGLRGFGKKEEAAGSRAAPGIVPGKMVAPIRELCVGCHAEHAPAAIAATGRVAHGPVADGLCVLCHAPHAAPEQYLLAKKANALCVDCHAAGFMQAQNAAHQGSADCAACHDPHAGSDRRLLKAGLGGGG